MKSTVAHIFYVDDDVDDIDLFKEALNSVCSDVQLTTLTNSQLFLSTLQKISLPDVIVLDVNMPAVNGIECLKQVRESEVFKHIPVVLFSTSMYVTKVQESIRFGANHYILKGSSMQEFTSFIRDLCEGKLSPLADLASEEP
jgi:CheY-like chemotaxis protein